MCPSRESPYPVPRILPRLDHRRGPLLRRWFRRASSDCEGPSKITRSCHPLLPWRQYTSLVQTANTALPSPIHPPVPGVVGHRQRFGLVLQQHPSGPRICPVPREWAENCPAALRCLLIRRRCTVDPPVPVRIRWLWPLQCRTVPLKPPSALLPTRRHDRSRLHSCTTNDMLSPL